MSPKFFIGIDISKFTLDIALLSGHELLLQEKIDNTAPAIKLLIQRLKKEHQCTA